MRRDFTRLRGEKFDKVIHRRNDERTNPSIASTSPEKGHHGSDEPEQGQARRARSRRHHQRAAGAERQPQHEGDSDILGVPGWSIEVKRVEKTDPADIRRWWGQAVSQALRDGGVLPALFYRQSRRDWRVLWPLSALMRLPDGTLWPAYEYAVEGTPEAWAAVVREAAK